MPKFAEFTTWLTVLANRTPDGKYEHVLATDDATRRAAILKQLRAFVSEAHEDARKRLRRLASGSLDPLASFSGPDPAAGYPEQLHIQTLKGYFGEILAGLAAANLNCFGIADWEVPVHLFRFHLVEFQQLAMINQTGDAAGLRPGRTGDDCLAFRRDGDGRIYAALFCEAKCTASHSAKLINEAHEKSSLTNLLPVDVLQLIDVLEDSTDPAAATWVDSLRSLYLVGPHAGYERFDQVTYVCGSKPSKQGRKTWISSVGPHPKYTGRRRLQVTEIQLSDVEDLIKDAYGVN